MGGLMQETYDYLDEKYGLEGLALKMCEEQAELSIALLHLPKTSNMDNLIEEIVDNLIISERLINYFNIHNEVSEIKIKKMLELKERVKNGKL